MTIRTALTPVVRPHQQLDDLLMGDIDLDLLFGVDGLGDDDGVGDEFFMDPQAESQVNTPDKAAFLWSALSSSGRH